MSDNTNPRATGEAVADVLQSYANWYHDHVSRGGWTNGSHVDNKRSCEAARLVEMFATHPAPRGRVVVTEAEIAGMKADADAGWDHVELFRDALSHANKIAREHSAIEDGPLTVVRFSTPTWLAFLQSMGKRLALVDEEPEQARGRVVKLLDDWRVVTKDGTWVDQFGKRVWADAECASRNSSKAWANHAPHRVMRVALVDAGEGKTCGACHGEREVSEHECCGNSTSMECCGNSVEVRVSCLFCG
ncbi:hypothetical protein, partial [Gemmatimonas sp.]|uniref:hypothetical protein n=1 Tax=Gemmatimonas sp. TaxID=1962908 RepID=UPI00333F1D3A